MLLFLVSTGMALCQCHGEVVPHNKPPNPGKAVASPHCKGPDGLDSWALLYRPSGNDPSSESDRVPLAIVVARDGHVLRRIRGNAILWEWFFPDDQRIAFEDGPRHFVMVCRLLDLASGKVLAEYDCFHSPPHPPAWVQRLLAGKSTCTYF